jgi:hypothetical protein
VSEPRESYLERWRLSFLDPRHLLKILRIVWLLGSQDPIPDTADTRCHLMRMEPEDKGGSEAEETREEFTMREMGSIFPETEEAESGRESRELV